MTTNVNAAPCLQCPFPTSAWAPFSHFMSPFPRNPDKATFPSAGFAKASCYQWLTHGSCDPQSLEHNHLCAHHHSHELETQRARPELKSCHPCPSIMSPPSVCVDFKFFNLFCMCVCVCVHVYMHTCLSLCSLHVCRYRRAEKRALDILEIQGQVAVDAGNKAWVSRKAVSSPHCFYFQFALIGSAVWGERCQNF